MTFQAAFNALCAAYEQDGWFAANNTAIIKGINAHTQPSDFTEILKGKLADHPFTIAIELPGAAVMADSPFSTFLEGEFAAVLVENPQRSREGDTLISPLTAIHRMFRAVKNLPEGPNSHMKFKPAANAMKYMGEQDGCLFYRFLFNINIIVN